MVSIVKRLGCIFGRHAPARRAVRYEGHLKVGPCRYCGLELEKHGDGHWTVRKDARRGDILED